MFKAVCVHYVLFRTILAKTLLLWDLYYGQVLNGSEVKSSRQSAHCLSVSWHSGIWGGEWGNVWKSLYLNCREWYEDIDHHSYAKLNGICSIQPLKWSPTLKWSPNRPWNDPIFLLVDPEIIPKEWETGGETWDCGLLSCSLLKCCNPLISFHSYEVSN